MQLQSILLVTSQTSTFQERSSIMSFLKDEFSKDNTKLSKNHIYIIQTTKRTIGIKDVEEVQIINSQKTRDVIKVICILDADKLTIEAQNALLKVIEEPSSNTQIVLIAKNKDSFLNTINSRCRVINWKSTSSNAHDTDVGERFLNERSLINRAKLFEKVYTSKQKRVASIRFMDYILKTLMKHAVTERDTKLVEIIEIAKETYIALNRGTNIKLTLDRFNLHYQEQFN